MVNKKIKYISVIGYGTFITNMLWKNSPKIEPCLVKDYKRILPEGLSFPFIIENEKSSFWGLKFDVTIQEIKRLDLYEGVPNGLFKRELIDVYLRNNFKTQAYIYLPTKKTIKSLNLSKYNNEKDHWKNEIRKFPEIIKRFPELIL